ncbi:HIT family protein [Vibrio albus]|jgi:diadenosine tetraphosphate (Ap4A) HIT family hydrolase|uniref:HIT family protein n=1 Tax=Vibrio albus TaxID=2200953 RepID=A0A2U3BBX0_9VIBR|nr:HIT domain-containing protein [Vibrio albus]PWI34277.1 HIT family protein [Vibrio albus]
MAFTLHPRLESDTDLIGEFPLCLALLSKDASVPWVILVPKVDGVREIHHMPLQDQQQFLLESQRINCALEKLFMPDKLNFGALGNLVPQLHVHHIVRYISDEAWPGPIWGNTTGKQRTEAEQTLMIRQIRDELAKDHNFQY